MLPSAPRRYASAALIALAAWMGAGEAPPLGNENTDAWGKHVQVGDGFFPAEGDAATAITCHPSGFRDHGRPTFVASGSIHYARVPRELWRDRLLRLRRLGFSWIETYVFWNWHEPTEGRVDFTGQRDLAAFLALAHELGLRVLVRVGPYSCAEWSEGGFPSWLRSRSDMRLRIADPRYLEAVSRWFAVLLPIVAAAQVHRGGPVGMVQLENEHPHGGGTAANPNGAAYFAHLLALARRHGIAVPMFFSGMHHSHDPAGKAPWDGTTRTGPWFSTEFWTTWYTNRGAGSTAQVQGKTRGIWKMIAFGASGYNLYMAHGGTTFGTWSNDELAASYDFGAPIGQLGDLRPLAHRVREANLFATTCADLLQAAPTTVSGPPAGAEVRTWLRTSPLGTLRFLDNPGNTPATVTLPDGGTLTLAASEIVPLFDVVAVDPVFTVSTGPGRVLARVRDGLITTLVLRLAPADRGAATIRAGETPPIELPLAASAAPLVREFSHGGQQLRVVILAQDQVDRCWLLDGPAGPCLLVGCGWPIEADGDRLVAEPGDERVLSLGRDGLSTWVRSPSPGPGLPPALDAWSMQPDDPREDGQWSPVGPPQQLGLLGGAAAWGWYRASVELPTGARGLLRFDHLGDHAQVFVGGQPLGRIASAHDSLPLDLPAGNHELAVFVGHDGRDKLFFNTGVLATHDRKGLYGEPVLLTPGTGGGPTHSWRWRALTGDAPPTPAELTATTTGADWNDVAWGSDLFNRTPGRILAIGRFGALVGARTEVRAPPIDDQAELWVNGVRLGAHRGWRNGFVMAIPPEALRPADNVLAIVVGNRQGPGGLSAAPAVAAWDLLPGVGDGVVRGWRSREAGDQPPLDGWRAPTTMPAVPAWWRTSFAATPDESGELRFAWGGLARGQAWLNGQALGRFPDPVDPRGLWLPRCWLRADGRNELVIFDADGGQPTGAALVIDPEGPPRPVAHQRQP